MSDNKPSNKQPAGKDWSKDREGAFNFVFNTHLSGNRLNSGKGPNGSYKRKEK